MSFASSSKRTGRGSFGNGRRQASRFSTSWERHLRTGGAHVYTSCGQRLSGRRDTKTSSRVTELYRAARSTTRWSGPRKGLGVGRFLATSPLSEGPGLQSHARRRDYALPPFGETLLDRVKGCGRCRLANGKVEDLLRGARVTSRITRSATKKAWIASSSVSDRRRPRAGVRETSSTSIRIGHATTTGNAANLGG